MPGWRPSKILPSAPKSSTRLHHVPLSSLGDETSFVDSNARELTSYRIMSLGKDDGSTAVKKLKCNKFVWIKIILEI